MIVLELLIILFLFLGRPVCVVLFHWSTSGNISTFTSVHPILYLLLIYAVISWRKLLSDKFHLKNVFFIFSLTILYYLIPKIYLSRLLDNLLIPLLFSFFIIEVSKERKSKDICKKWFIFLFTIETFLAIIERITGKFFFPYEIWETVRKADAMGTYFRSTSLLGNPLTNALCVAVTLAFVACSNNISNFLRYILLTGGFIALLCFNARAATIISVSFYMLYSLFANKFNIKTLIALLVIGCLLGYAFFSLGLGDRILGQKIGTSDDSTFARIKILSLVDKIDLSLLFAGPGMGAMEIATGQDYAENWLLTMVFNLGILLTIYYVYMMLRLCFKWLTGLSNLQKLYLFGVFIIVASSNNSLAEGVPAISFFIISSAFLIDKPNAGLLYLRIENSAG